MKTDEGYTPKDKKEKKKVSSLDGVVCSNPGCHTQPVYKRVYDKKLDRSIVKQVDTFDLYEFIQASMSQTDLAILQKRFVELGEIPEVNPALGSNDLSVMPSNIHEVYNMANDIANNFAKLPKSIQSIFGTKEAYMKALIDGTYQATIVNYVKSLDAVKKQDSPAEEKKPEEKKD